MIERGQLYLYDFGPPRDRRQAGRRPVLVVQTDHLNRVPGYDLTHVIPLTTKPRPAPSRIQIDPTEENGLNAVSYAICEQVFLVPIEELLELRGKVTIQDMYRIAQALKAVFAIP